MPANFQLSGGTTPNRKDTRWFAWARQLFKWQSIRGADNANNPNRSDTRRGLVVKVLKSINGE